MKKKDLLKKALSLEERKHYEILLAQVGVNGGRGRSCGLIRVRRVCFAELIPLLEWIEYLFLITKKKEL